MLIHKGRCCLTLRMHTMSSIRTCINVYWWVGAGRYTEPFYPIIYLVVLPNGSIKLN